MASNNRFWINAAKGAFLLMGCYTIAMSLWCGSVGRAFKDRELRRDQEFHSSLEKLSALEASLRREGITDPAKDARYGAAVTEASALADRLLEDSSRDMRGTDAIRITAFGAVGLLGAYFLTAGLVHHRRRVRPSLQPQI
jgi:hypothetical protein